MEPIKLLLVSFREEWRTNLLESLHFSGYYFEIEDVFNKKQALQACYASKYDIVITSHFLPDGSSDDLVKVLGSIIPCLVIKDEGHLKMEPTDAENELNYIERCYHTLRHPMAWITTLKQVMIKWEKSVAGKIAQGRKNQRQLFDKVAARCAHELYHSTENRIENALKVILEIMQVSRVYIRDTPSPINLASSYIHEISAPGQSLPMGPYHSVFEVPIIGLNGQRSYLGVEDTTNQRVWEKAETDLLKTIATLLTENKGGIRNKIDMYGELGMTA